MVVAMVIVVEVVAAVAMVIVVEDMMTVAVVEVDMEAARVITVAAKTTDGEMTVAVVAMTIDVAGLGNKVREVDAMSTWSEEAAPAAAIQGVDTVDTSPRDSLQQEEAGLTKAVVLPLLRPLTKAPLLHRPRPVLATNRNSQPLLLLLPHLQQNLLGLNAARTVETSV